MKENATINNQELQKSGFEEFYLNCTFEMCDFSTMLFSNVHFEECIFKQCNFSMARFFCQFNDVQFIECKITGSDFSGMSKFSNCFQFDRCTFMYASFIESKLSEARFTDCTIAECDFMNSDLSGSVFERCDLSRSQFVETNLERVNLESSYGFAINPSINRTKKMIISQSELRGLVSHLNIVIK